MSKRRMLFMARLEPRHVDEYVYFHKQVWPELLDAYQRSGITQISCFLHGCDLIVYSEVDAEIYEREKDALSQNPVELRWQSLMKSFRDPAAEERQFEEVFYMPPVA